MYRQDEINSMTSDLMAAQSLSYIEALLAIYEDSDISFAELFNKSGLTFEKLVAARKEFEG